MKKEDQLIIEIFKRKPDKDKVASLLEQKISIDYIHQICEKHLITADFYHSLLTYPLPQKLKQTVTTRAKQVIFEVTSFNNLINQELILSFLNEGDKWSLEFIRESLIDKPDSFEEWQAIKDEFIKILKLDPTTNAGEKDTILKKKKWSSR